MSSDWGEDDSRREAGAEKNSPSISLITHPAADDRHNPSELLPYRQTNVLTATKTEEHRFVPLFWCNDVRISDVIFHFFSQHFQLDMYLGLGGWNWEFCLSLHYKQGANVDGMKQRPVDACTLHVMSPLYQCVRGRIQLPCTSSS